MSELPLVSIIIPHQAGTEVLVACLDSLQRDASYPHTEILLVDNGSSDGSVEEARRRFPRIRVLRLERNQGYAGGCNRGIEASNGKYVVLLNDDTELEPGWLGELVRAAEEDPSVAACQPKIRSLVDRASFEYSGAAGGLMDVYAYPFSRGRLMGHVEEDRGQYDDPIEIFWASGVCMLVRRAALDEAGLFDEVFFAYMEEIDLCWRLQLQGLRIVYVPTSVVYHIGGYSLDQRVLKRMYLNHRNSTLTLVKNYSARSLAWILPVKVGLELFILAGALLRNPRRSRAVVMSFAWLLTHVPTVLRLRRGVQRRRRVTDRAIFDRLYYGMAPLWYFVFGVRRVPDLPDIDRVLHRPYRPNHKPARGESVRPQPRDFLYAYLDQAPTARALTRAADCGALAQLDFSRPILELGCDDGVFSRVLFNGVIVDAAIEPDPRRAALARETRCFGEVGVAPFEALPFAAESVSTVFANRSLPRARHAGAALGELHRVLGPGGRFALTLPASHAWARAEAGEAALRAAGLELERIDPYGAPAAARLAAVFGPLAAATARVRRAAGRRLLLPRLHRLVVRSYRRWLRGATGRGPVARTGATSVLLVGRKPEPGRGGDPGPTRRQAAGDAQLAGNGLGAGGEIRRNDPADR